MAVLKMYFKMYVEASRLVDSVGFFEGVYTYFIVIGTSRQLILSHR